jgi:D-alanyl-D-alanine carboxypeptidase (penicillin-binding protein 5/6)
MKRIYKILFLTLFIFNIQYVFAIDISSPSAVVICEDTGRILYDKNANEKRKMASLTKLMTSILLVENCNMDEKISVAKEACYIGGSEAGIMPNEEITAKDLLYGMLLPSGNDCALAIGYHIGGNVENFATLMNEKAKELGLKDTHFENPHGLDSEDHYTTAYEMALIAKYAKSYDIIEEVVSTKEKNVTFGNRTVNLRNTNALLRTYPYATGMKTGFTNGANRCLVASATKDNLNLIAVVLGSETSQIRFNDAQDILDATFDNYSYYDISNFINVYIDIPIIKGKKENYIQTFSEEKYEALTNEEYSKIYVTQNFIQKIQAPMYKGEYIGTYTVKIDDEILYSKDFYLEEDLLKKTPIDYFINCISNMFVKLEKI